MTQTEVILSGLRFPEGARWHDDQLWFSDMHTGQVLRMDPHTHALTEVTTVSDQPSGLGWLPDGSLLISCMLDRKVVRLWPSGSISTHADVSTQTDSPINDLVVDDRGRTFDGLRHYRCR